MGIEVIPDNGSGDLLRTIVILSEPSVSLQFVKPLPDIHLKLAIGCIRRTRHGPMEEGNILQDEPMVVFLTLSACHFITSLGVAHLEFPAISVEIVSMEEYQEGKPAPAFLLDFGEDEDVVLLLSQSIREEGLGSDIVPEPRPSIGREQIEQLRVVNTIPHVLRMRPRGKEKNGCYQTGYPSHRAESGMTDVRIPERACISPHDLICPFLGGTQAPTPPRPRSACEEYSNTCAGGLPCSAKGETRVFHKTE